MKCAYSGHLTEACSLKPVWKEKESLNLNTSMRKSLDLINPRNEQHFSYQEKGNRVINAITSETNFLPEIPPVLDNNLVSINSQIFGNKKNVSNPEISKDNMDIISIDEQSESPILQTISKNTKENASCLNVAMDTVQQKGMVGSADNPVPNGNNKEIAENQQQSHEDNNVQFLILLPQSEETSLITDNNISKDIQKEISAISAKSFLHRVSIISESLLENAGLLLLRQQQKQKKAEKRTYMILWIIILLTTLI